MDDKRFDELAKRVGASRRSMLKKMVGLGGAAAVARLGISETEAARRGYGDPSSPGLQYEAYICTLENPYCCAKCGLYEWTNVNTIRDRFADCVASMPTTGRNCDYCRSTAVKVWEGEGCGIP